MSLSISRTDRAQKVLDLCLSSESPDMQRRVYEIIHQSGLQPNDPMFLVLALTGQMRVFLESAPMELNQLLSEWKNQSASSLSEIDSAISLIKQTQLEQAEVIQGELSNVSAQCVSDIKEAGMATVSAIAEANSATLEQLEQTKRQIKQLVVKVSPT